MGLSNDSRVWVRMQFKLNQCPNCRGAVIEIDHYGERLIGCIECNRWIWRGSERLLMELPEEDIEALRQRIEALDE
jgi:hypothetical protein